MIRRGLHLPILWCHGTNDNEIPAAHGMDAISFVRDTLQIQEEYITYKLYEGLSHRTNDAELADVASWLANILDNFSTNGNNC
jgi:predicted esterase